MGDNEMTSDLIDEGKELIRRGESGGSSAAEFRAAGELTGVLSPQRGGSGRGSKTERTAAG